MKQRIVFFGSGPYVHIIFDRLREKFNISLIVTTETLPSENIPKYCSKSGIPCLSVGKIDKQVLQKVKKINAQIAILAFFGVILPHSLLDLFPKGIINVHPSLLPKYRGPTPVQSAIFNGDSVTGVSIMLLDDQVDHGPIFLAKKEPIHSDDTNETLHARLFSLGAELLNEILPEYLAGKISPHEQEHKYATFTNQLSRKDSFINLENPPGPEMLDRMIRAYYPWPTVWTRYPLFGHERRIIFLPENKIQVEGKKVMTRAEFVNGYQEAARTFLSKLGLSHAS